MKLDHEAIAARIPHRGSMCLLDAVDAWDAESIVCRTRSHLSDANPLRSDGRLGIAAGIEYAAQAMAVHGALLSGGDALPATGFLVSVRDVNWQRSRLDDLASDLVVRAMRISGNAANILYAFSVLADGATLLTGRAAVITDATTPLPS
jgi:predicted hotdog family 3-hydroxylacyl-ACP dehydratase